MNSFSFRIVATLLWAAVLFCTCQSVCALDDDPNTDGWRTEALSAQLQARLVQLVEATRDQSDLASFLSDDARCTLIDESHLISLRSDATVEIKKLADSNSPLAADSRFETGFRRLLRGLTDDGRDKDAPPKFRLKITRIELSGDHVSARAMIYGSRQTELGFLQLNSTWQTAWRLAGDSPKLESLSVLGHEEIMLKSQSPWFADATASVFRADVAFEKQLTLGVGSWINRIERFGGSNIYSKHGHALGDVNGDGLDDLYLCQPGGLPNRLFVQQPDGRLLDHSSQSKVDWLNDTRSALIVDLDNDGDQDLVVGTSVGVYFCRNNGRAEFELAGSLPKIEMDISSLSAVDYDNDGDLDIHVCVYHSNARMEGRDAANQNVYDLRSLGGMNRLYQNQLDKNDAKNGTNDPSLDLEFVDVTVSAGMEVGNQRYSYAASWEDFDNDGDQDLYVANDFGINCLYRNQAGKFEEVASQLGVADYGPGMSSAWGDYNRDGNPDLYVGNMFSAAGNRVTRQEQFKVNAFGTSKESFLRFNKGNSLYAFNGERFEEIPGAGGAENAQWAWSSLLEDMDNDGWQDALVANGYITGPGGGDL